MTDDELDQQIKHHYQEADRLAKERKERRAKKRAARTPAWVRTVHTHARVYSDIFRQAPVSQLDSALSGIGTALAGLDHAMLHSSQPFLTEILHGHWKDLKRIRQMIELGQESRTPHTEKEA